MTACLIVRDEAHNLSDCLTSLQRIADETVVVDTGSSDGTPALAESLGARVIHEAWRHDFALHRNTSLRHARGQWCLVVDADERLDSGADEARALLEQGEALPDILLVQLTLSYPEETVESAAPRLLRRAAGPQYIYPVHERLKARSPEVLLSPLRFTHLGYRDLGQIRAKHQRNLALAQRGDPADPHLLHCIARAAFALQQWEVSLQACSALALAEGAAGPAAAESAVLGALSALSLADHDSLVALVAAGSRMRPEHPDQRLLSAVLAALRYHAAVSGEPSEALTLFEHLPEVAEQVLTAFPLAALSRLLSARLMQPLVGRSA